MGNYFAHQLPKCSPSLKWSDTTINKGVCLLIFTPRCVCWKGRACMNKQNGSAFLFRSRYCPEATFTILIKTSLNLKALFRQINSTKEYLLNLPMDEKRRWQIHGHIITQSNALRANC